MLKAADKETFVVYLWKHKREISMCVLVIYTYYTTERSAASTQISRREDSSNLILSGLFRRWATEPLAHPAVFNINWIHTETNRISIIDTTYSTTL
jgi:hypothetical protein